MKNKQTQISLIKRHLKENGNITSWDAIVLYNVTRLASYIHTLRKYGMDIESINENKKGVTYSRYKLN
jgi:hypothetical protein